MIDLTDNESKKGALAALNLILQSRQRKLRKQPGDSSTGNKLKMPKNIEDVEDDISEDEMPKETPEEKQARLDRINDELTGEKGEELAKQIRQQAQAKKQAQQAETQAKLKAKQDALDKINKKVNAGRNGALANISMFKNELKRCIGEQMKIRKTPQDTFTKPNAKFAGTNLMVPVQKTFEHHDKPIIHVYFDKSGSVSESSLQKAVEALKELDIYRKRKMCDYKIFFFASEVSNDPNEVGGGTTAFPEILAHLKKTHANNAIIITDDDFDGQTKFDNLTPLDLKGCVWWFWHKGQRAKTAFVYLQGKKGTFQYRVS